MVNDSRRKNLSCHIRQLIRTDHHAVVAAFETINEPLNCGFIEIGVVGIELDGIFTATRVMNGHVPVAAYRVPGLVLRDIDEFIVLNSLNLLGCAIRGVIIHDNDVERIGSTHFLCKCRVDSISYGTCAVLTRNDDRGRYRIVFGFRQRLVLTRFQVCPDTLEVRGNTLLHLYLHFTVARIDVVEQFLSGLTGIGLYFVVQVFRNMLEFLCPQTQVVQSGELVLRVHLCDESLEFCGVPKENSTEIKIISQRADLIVDYRCFGNHFVDLREMIRIDHRCAGHLHHLHHSLLSQVHPFNIGFETDHRVWFIRFLCDLFNRFRAAYSAR